MKGQLSILVERFYGRFRVLIELYYTSQALSWSIRERERGDSRVNYDGLSNSVPQTRLVCSVVQEGVGKGFGRLPQGASRSESGGEHRR